VIDPHLRAVVEDALVHNVVSFGEAALARSVSIEIWCSDQSDFMQAVLIFSGHRPDPTYEEMAERFCRQNDLLGKWNLDYTELIFVPAPEGQEGHLETGR
jgi:hypothetical protein